MLTSAILPGPTLPRATIAPSESAIAQATLVPPAYIEGGKYSLRLLLSLVIELSNTHIDANVVY
jgi:hypothetical protein